MSDQSRPQAVRITPGQAWRAGEMQPHQRHLAEETPVAFSYDGAAHAVMMATPADLEDFAVGFSLTEGIIDQPSAIRELEVVPVPDGINLRLWLEPAAAERAERRRRRLAGPVGCGLCGIESLAEANRALPLVTAQPRFTPAQVTVAMAQLAALQPLNQQTRAVHAAALWTANAGIVAVREDVGRHNALDKLAGALARGGQSPASGILLLTSRVSVEMVQKAASIGAPVIAAISAPTALAVRLAEQAGITLAAIVRGQEFELFTHPHRIDGKAKADVA